MTVRQCLAKKQGHSVATTSLPRKKYLTIAGVKMSETNAEGYALVSSAAIPYPPANISNPPLAVTASTEPNGRENVIWQLSVRKNGADPESLVEWSGNFKPIGVSDQEVISIVSGIYRSGLEALGHRFVGTNG